jgi:hypothetical protein
LAGDFSGGAQNAGTYRGSDAHSDAKARTEHAQQVARFAATLTCGGGYVTPLDWRMVSNLSNQRPNLTSKLSYSSGDCPFRTLYPLSWAGYRFFDSCYQTRK